MPPVTSLDTYAAIRALIGNDAPLLAVQRRRGLPAPHYRMTASGTLQIDPMYLRAPKKLWRDIALTLHPIQSHTRRGQNAERRVIRWYQEQAHQHRLAAVQHYRARVNPGCDGTPEQHAALKKLYDYFNTRYFGRRLPECQLRFLASPWENWGEAALENDQCAIDLHLCLTRPENTALLRESLLHEMCHLASWLFEPTEDMLDDADAEEAAAHGPAWQKWMRYVGLPPCRHGTKAPRAALRDQDVAVPLLPADCAATLRRAVHPVLVVRAGHPQLRRKAAYRRHTTAPRSTKRRRKA